MTPAKQKAKAATPVKSQHSPFIQKAESEQFFSGESASSFIQPKLTIGRSDDHYEREADAVADRVVSGEPAQQNSFFNSANAINGKFFVHRKTQIQKSDDEEAVQPKLDGELQRSGLLEDRSDSVQEKSLVQTSSDSSGDSSPPASFESNLSSSKGGGSALSGSVKSGMESGIGADFSGVRIHTGSQATTMSNQIGARAFTHGNDIYFNEGQYEPETQDGQHLLAHELTHTVQQGASVQRKPQQISTNAPKVQKIADWILEELNDYARYIPGWTLFTVIIGYNPLLRRSVDRSPENLVGGLLELIPVFGVLMLNKLREHNILTDAFDWVRQQMSELNLTTGRLERTIEEAWEDVRILRSLDYNRGVLDRTFGQLYRDVVSFAGRIGTKVLELVTDALLSALKYIADRVPGYPLLTKILGKDPITDEPVEATTVEILEDFLLLIGGDQELEMMQEEGTLQETADWIDLNLEGLALAFDALKLAFFEVWDSFSYEDLRDPIAAFQRAVDKLAEPATRVFQFAYNVAAKVVELIKNVLLRKLSEYASETRGYHLLTVLLGKDPFTGVDVPRSIENIIRGFMSLMDGGEAQFQEMKASGSIARTTARVNAAVEELGFTWPYITGLFLELWHSFSINDIFNPVDAFVRIVNTIAAPIQRLFVFIVRIVKIVIEVFLEIMQFPSNLIAEIIGKVQAAWELIKRRPIEFIKNLLRGVLKGFQQFFDNIGTHLLNGLTGWLFGELGEAGITPPQDLSFGSILKLVMEVLGITVEKIWEKLGEHIGPERVERIRGAIDRLTGIWTFISDVINDGPAAIWTHIESFLSNLWDMVFGAVQNWVMERIVTAAMTKVLSMLDPTGIMAVVNSFIAIYNAIQSFIRYLTEMLQAFNRFVGGVLAIAQGNIQPAADKLENALGSVMPIAIGFLANQVGLGGIGRRVGEIIQGIQVKVDEALDWLIGRALAAGRSILNAITGGGGTNQEEPPPADNEIPEDGPAASLNALNSTFNDKTSDEHTLRFRGTGTPQIVVESDPIELGEFIRTKQNELPQNDPQQGALTQALGKYNALLPFLTQLVSLEPSTPAHQQAYEAIQTKYEEIKALLPSVEVDDIVYPPMQLPAFSGGLAAPFEAEYIREETVRNAPANSNAGSNDGTVEGWEEVQMAGLTGSGENWVRMHLLTHRFMGSFQNSNLTPTRGSLNNPTFLNLEEDADSVVRSNPTSAIWYRVNFSYQSVDVPASISSRSTSGRTTARYLSSLNAAWGTYDPATLAKIPHPQASQSTLSVSSIGAPDLTGNSLTNINDTSVVGWRTVIGFGSSIDRQFADFMIRVRNGLPHGFRSRPHMENQLNIANQARREPIPDYATKLAELKSGYNTVYSFGAKM